MRETKEERYYALVKRALEDHFRNQGYSVDFEVIGRRKTLLKKFLPGDSKLLKDVRAVPAPDVMGRIWRGVGKSGKLVIAEFKQSPRFRDIFQAKGYDELFNSDYTFLLSVEAISESSKSTIDFVRGNPDLLKTKCCRSQIYVYFLHETPEGVTTLARLGSETDLPDVATSL